MKMFWNFPESIVEVNAVVRHFRHPWVLIRNINDRVREVPKISPDIILGRYFEIMTRLGTISETSLGFNNRYLLVVVNG
jgi:hypothetical protein